MITRSDTNGMVVRSEENIREMIKDFRESNRVFMLAEHQHSFVLSVANFYENRGFISDKQWNVFRYLYDHMESNWDMMEEPT